MPPPPPSAGAVRRAWPPVTSRPILARGVCGTVRWMVCEGPFACPVGYVRLPAGHAWLAGVPDGMPVVHGGVTYGPDRAGWIGFHTTHYPDDFIPFLNPEGHRWTLPETVAETIRLCMRVAAMQHTGRPGPYPGGKE